jgi:hypothetical protein
MKNSIAQLMLGATTKKVNWALEIFKTKLLQVKF